LSFLTGSILYELSWRKHIFVVEEESVLKPSVAASFKDRVVFQGPPSWKVFFSGSTEIVAAASEVP